MLTQETVDDLKFILKERDYAMYVFWKRHSKQARMKVWNEMMV